MEKEALKEVKVNSKRFSSSCPECGSANYFPEGSCFVCLDCMYSPCK